MRAPASLRRALTALCAALAMQLLEAAGGAPADLLTVPVACEDCAKWNRPHAPVHVHGDTWIVGVQGLNSILVRTPQGLVLLDGALPQSVPLIEANLRALGARVQDVRYILVSHEHFDHVGGVAALQRDSGATVLAGAAAIQALRAGGPTPEDPQYRSRPSAFPVAAGNQRAVEDGESFTLGGTTFTAHRTPGHTPGSTSWTWRSCEPADCREIVYADSLSAVSSLGYRFPAGDLERFRRSIAKVRALPCDILLTPHPEQSDLWERVARRSKDATVDPMLDREACRKYADEALKGLEQRVQAQSR